MWPEEINSKKMRLVIGIVIYKEEITAKYLPYFLNCLKEQTFKDFALVVFDNNEKEDKKSEQFLKECSPNIKIIGEGRNTGFAYAYNRLIRNAVEMEAKYFLAINPDVILESDTIEKLIKAIELDGELGSVCPKILKWDFEKNRKTDIIDSCGIRLGKGLGFLDTGQSEKDNGQFNNVEILGPSGAAALYRLNALEKVREDKNYFDELMFMYKEDCDLAYRLFLAGFKSKCVNDALAYHDRTAAGKGESDWQIALNRGNKSRLVKEWSFLNQQIIFLKYWHIQSFWNKLAIVWRELKMLVFVVLFERYLLGQLRELLKIKKEIKVYR